MSGVDPNAGGPLVVGGAGAPLSDATPAAPGTAAAGTSTSASRADHVHTPTTAAQAGAPTLATLTTNDDIYMRLAGVVTRFATTSTGKALMAAASKKAARGAIELDYVASTKTTSYTAVGGDVLFVDATAGAVTVTLPTAAGQVQSIRVKKTDASANAVTIDGAGSETIDGAATLVLTTQYEAVELWSDGTAWGVF